MAVNLSMDHIPTALERDDQGALIITWSDQSRTRSTAAELRKSCPCATCREKHSDGDTKSNPMMLPVISMAEAQPLNIRSMRPVGNYAYNIAFSDGHDSGIFTFDFLRALGAELS